MVFNDIMMYKSSAVLLRCLLRSTSLLKCDSVISSSAAFQCQSSRSCDVWSGWERNTQGCSSESVRYYCQYSKHADLLKLSPVSEVSSDKAERMFFLTHLQGCVSPVDVLDALKQVPESRQQVSSALTHMWDTAKRMTDEQRHYELRLVFEHPAFQELCDRAASDAPRMRSDDLTYSLLAMVKLGVAQNTRVVQTLLRVIQERLNHFDEKSLSILAGSIRDMEDSKNVQALREALRLLLKDRVSEIQSVVVLQSLMRTVGRDSPVHLKKTLAMKALSMTDEFSPPNTQYMFFTLAAMGLCSKPLLDICSRKISENVHEFPFSRLLAVLKSCHELRYRNSGLFSSVSEYVTSTFDMWSNKQVILFLVTFEDLAFRPVSLLDAFAERILQKSDTLTLKDLMSVLKVYSLLNHDLKDNREEFLKVVTRCLESYLCKISHTELLKCLHYLALLGHFPHTLLEKLLQQDVQEQLLQKGRQSAKVQRWLQSLDLCLRLDNPPLPPSVTSVTHLQLTGPAQKVPVNQEVLGVIRGIVGNDAVQENVLEQGVYFIDCVINPDQTEVICDRHTDDSVSHKRQRMAVVCAPLHAFCFESTHPRGSLAVKLRHLEKLGYKLVLVPVHEFSSQTEEEKRQMLQKLILPAEEFPETQTKQPNSPEAS